MAVNKELKDKQQSLGIFGMATEPLNELLDNATFDVGLTWDKALQELKRRARNEGITVKAFMEKPEFKPVKEGASIAMQLLFTKMCCQQLGKFPDELSENTKQAVKRRADEFTKYYYYVIYKGSGTGTASRILRGADEGLQGCAGVYYNFIMTQCPKSPWNSVEQVERYV